MVLTTWDNYNLGVVYDKVKNTAAQIGRHGGCLLYYMYDHYTCGFVTRLAHYNVMNT